jgi:hypothetical protein
MSEVTRPELENTALNRAELMSDIDHYVTFPETGYADYTLSDRERYAHVYDNVTRHLGRQGFELSQDLEDWLYMCSLRIQNADGVVNAWSLGMSKEEFELADKLTNTKAAEFLVDAFGESAEGKSADRVNAEMQEIRRAIEQSMIRNDEQGGHDD